ncbi:hypothetical protein MRB53_025419 [Persea americana]|uniref:Uncharacterized protein n=1 Tax=Persea americana TaxID=3435 RepID=A0ACC2LG60_PERAE|nr:hypothetical protein MRB53_025419 [Persea americana]
MPLASSFPIKTPVLMVGPSQLTDGVDRCLPLKGETFKNLIIDQATIFIHKEKLHILLLLIEDGLTIVLKRFHWMKERLVGFFGKVTYPMAMEKSARVLQLP